MATTSKKTNVTKATKSISQASEEQLRQQAEQKRQAREKKLIDELNEWCQKNNCTLITTVDVRLNGQPVGVSLRAL